MTYRQKFFLYCFVFFCVIGCSTPGAVKFSTEKHSLKNILKAVVKEIPGGIRKKSQNGRVLFSGFFSPLENKSDIVRAHIQVSILGDRRPYEISLLCKIDRKSKSGDYSFLRNDIQIAKKYAFRIKKRLVQSRDSRSVIDDFRAF